MGTPVQVGAKVHYIILGGALPLYLSRRFLLVDLIATYRNEAENCTHFNSEHHVATFCFIKLHYSK